MKLLFKSSHHVAGKDYKKGVHDVPKEVLQDPYLRKLIGLGLVFEAPPELKKDSPDKDKGAKLLEKIAAEAEEPEDEDSDEEDEAEEPEESEEESEDESEESESEDFMAKPEKAKKKKAKKKKSGR